MRNEEVDFLARTVRIRLSELLDGTGRDRALAEVAAILKRERWKSVLFGGSMRDLLLKEAGYKSRDYDIVVADVKTSELREAFERYLVRQTRFGGLRLRMLGADVDIWPLDETWAVKNGALQCVSFETLPCTTFLNIEAIAGELHTRALDRRIYSQGFFEAVMRRQIEINYEPNPFPQLCVIRSIVAAESIKYSVGPRLRQYIAYWGSAMDSKDIERIQIEHYGKVVLESGQARGWIERSTRVLDADMEFAR